MRITYMIIIILCSVLFLSPSESLSMDAINLSTTVSYDTTPVPMNAIDIYNTNSSKTAIISVYKKDQNFAGNELTNLGAGVVIRKNTLLTCLHVVENAKMLKVEINSKTILTDNIVYTNKEHDIALVKLDMNIEPVKTSDKIDIGEEVFCIANPNGYKRMITKGVLSGAQNYNNKSYFVIDAAIAKGSSGGGVYNSSGELLGMVQFYMKEAPGFNFILPIKTILELIKE